MIAGRFWRTAKVHFGSAVVGKLGENSVTALLKHESAEGDFGDTSYLA